MENFYNELKQLAMNEGMALFGVADVTAVKETFLIPEGVGKRFDRAVSLGFRLSGSVLDTVTDKPNQIYYFHYQRTNILLDQTALKIAARIQAQGYEAFPIPASQVVDWDKQLGTLSHREIARLAGLGWYGRNNLLVNSRYGSQVRYTTVLTDMPLGAGSPVEGNCGACHACAAACPSKAIGDHGFDRDACHQKLKEFIKIQRVGQMICGVCQKVCKGQTRTPNSVKRET